MRFLGFFVVIIGISLAAGVVFAEGSLGDLYYGANRFDRLFASTSFATLFLVRHALRRLGASKIRARADATYLFVKRVADILFSTVALLLLTPVFVLIGLVVAGDSRGPIVHKRMVVGKDGKKFAMFKFRTMVHNADSILYGDEELKAAYYEGHCKLVSDPRVTRIGGILRKTSLDELPQFLNILFGEMTFVGPRPIAFDEIDLYGSQFEKFKVVKPGITGLWQVSGRSETSYEKRVELDMHYLNNRSIAFDLCIILKTVPAVVFKRGAF